MTMRELITAALGEHVDGYADPVETPNNWARATLATDAILAAISDAGFVIVPREPNGCMVDAGRVADEKEPDGNWRPEKVWQAMIAAAQ